MALFDSFKNLFSSPQPAREKKRNLPRCLGAQTVAYVNKTSLAGLEVRKLVDLLLADAVEAQASDVHLDPFEDHILARFRIDGMLHDVIKLPVVLKGQIANRFKVMADLKVYVQRVPQDGKARADDELGGFEMRISLSPMIAGEKISIRLFRPGQQQYKMQALGFEEDAIQAFFRAVEQPNGLVLLTGPVGSGKTTALYAALTHLADTRGERLNLTTVEDPVECTLPRVNQA